MKNLILFIVLINLTLVVAACRQPATYSDSRFDLPNGVKYDDYAEQESFKMPKMYAGTTMPEHWQNMPRSGSGHAAEYAKYTTSPTDSPNTEIISAHQTPQKESAVQPVSYQQTQQQSAIKPAITQSANQKSTSAKNATQSPKFPSSGQSEKMPLETLPIPAANSQVFSPDFSIDEMPNAKRSASMIYRGQSPEPKEEKPADEFGGFDDTDLSGETKSDDKNSSETKSEETPFASTEESSTEEEKTPTEESPKSEDNKENPQTEEKNPDSSQTSPPAKKAIDLTLIPRHQESIAIDPSLKQQGKNITSHPQVTGVAPRPEGYYWGKLSHVSPQEEYITDGGDNWASASIRRNGEFRGIEPEDTIVQYDTLDKRTLIEKSNPVHIYSPRFGSVRKIDGLEMNEQWLGYATIDSKIKLRSVSERTKIGKTQQNKAAAYTRSQVILREADAGANLGVINTHRSPMTYTNQEVTHSLSRLLTHKTFSSTELVYLAQGRAAAVAWGGVDNIEVYADERMAQAMIGVKTPEAILFSDKPNATTPKLKLFKDADRDAAQRGDIVEFMIRFENVGSELVGNITIIDSLTARLEYITGSAGSSVPAEFFTEPNESGSLKLRWELSKPLEIGEFGVLRFRCRVL